jgi:glycosyltransferase involved in cell wall biosynthesis
VANLCGDVIKKAAEYAQHVIVVDDGSTDQTQQVLDEIAQSNSHVHVLTHSRNQGKGAALLTAFRYALKTLDCGIFITLDGDAQHRPEDIPRLADKIRETKAALVIGERDAFMRMPMRSRIGNEGMSRLLRFVYSNAPKDTQSGLRAHSREFLEATVERIEGRRYETELYILLLALHHKAGVASVSIPTLYLESNASSHFNPIRDSLRILGALLFWCSIRFIKHK